MTELSREQKNEQGMAQKLSTCPNCGDCWSWKKAGSVQYEKTKSGFILICTECLENPSTLSTDKIRTALLSRNWFLDKVELAVKTVEEYKTNKEVRKEGNNEHDSSNC